MSGCMVVLPTQVQPQQPVTDQSVMSSSSSPKSTSSRCPLAGGVRGNSSIPARDVLLAALPLLLPMLSPRVRMEMPLKLLALVTGGRRLRMEPSESVLLHGRGSSDLISLSVLLWRLPEARFKPSRLLLGKPEESDGGCGAEGQQQDLRATPQQPRQPALPRGTALHVWI